MILAESLVESATAVSPTFYLAGVLGLGMVAQWLAWRFKVPAIILLLAFGFVVGVTIGPPADYVPRTLLYPLVALSVGVILFEGGLSLSLHEVKGTRDAVFRLVTVGLLITWGLATLSAWGILGLSLDISALLGALLTVSGPTVIMPILRHVRPNRRIGSLIKWEGIINDPIGAILAALVFEFVAHPSSGDLAGFSIRELGMTILVGVFLGGIGAWAMLHLLRNYLIPDYLQNPFFLAMTVLMFAVSNSLQPESGLLTVTLAGILIANQDKIPIHHVVEFKENLRTLLISTLFIVLASDVQLSGEQFTSFGIRTFLFVASLILIIRPIATYISTLGTDLTLNEKLLTCWIHPRGIVAASVASLFALQLAETPYAEEAQLFKFATFMTIVATVVVYGLTVGPLARKLKLARANPQGVLFVGASGPVRLLARIVKDAGFPILLVDTNPQKISSARLIGLPACLASIGSEIVRLETDLGDIGRLLAMTSNDEINALATMEFADEFGKAEAYQLASPEASGGRLERVPAHRRGRTLFAKELTFTRLEEILRDGGQFQKVALTEERSYADFVEQQGDSVTLLMVYDKDGKLTINTPDQKLSPKVGQHIIVLLTSPMLATADTSKTDISNSANNG